MSCDFAVWSKDEVKTDMEAKKLYTALCKEEYNSIKGNPAINDFYEDIISVYPEINKIAEENMDLCPWSSVFNRSDGYLIICCLWSKADEMFKLIKELAEKYELAVYDPQLERLFLPHKKYLKKASSDNVVIHKCDMRENEVRSLENILKNQKSDLFEILFYSTIVITGYFMSFGIYRDIIKTGSFNRDAVMTGCILAITIKLLLLIKNIKFTEIVERYDENITKDIKDKKVLEGEYSFTEAIKVEEFENEGIGFYFKISEDKTAFFQNQEFYYYDTNYEFPGSNIKIRKAFYSDVVLELKITGNPVPIILQRKAFSDEEIMKRPEFEEEGVVLDLSFEDLKREIIEKGLII